MFALIQNNAFVRWVNLKTDYPNTSFPYPIRQQDLPNGVVLVEMNNPAITAGKFEVVERLPAPVFEDGRWRLAYAVRPMAESEKVEATNRKAVEERARRDELLRTTVDTINPVRWDAMTEEMKNAWRTYRQDLLDVPQQAGFPWEVTWPSQPE